MPRTRRREADAQGVGHVPARPVGGTRQHVRNAGVRVGRVDQDVALAGGEALDRSRVRGWRQLDPHHAVPACQQARDDGEGDGPGPAEAPASHARGSLPARAAEGHWRRVEPSEDLSTVTRHDH